MRIKAGTCEWMRRASLILTVATFLFFWFSTYPDAKSGLKFKDLAEAGTALWVFLILGAIIILLQLIPAIMMFTGFLAGVHKSIPVKNEPIAEDCEFCKSVTQKE